MICLHVQLHVQLQQFQLAHHMVLLPRILLIACRVRQHFLPLQLQRRSEGVLSAGVAPRFSAPLWIAKRPCELPAALPRSGSLRGPSLQLLSPRHLWHCQHLSPSHLPCCPPVRSHHERLTLCRQARRNGWRHRPSQRCHVLRRNLRQRPPSMLDSWQTSSHLFLSNPHGQPDWSLMTHLRPPLPAAAYRANAHRPIRAPGVLLRPRQLRVAAPHLDRRWAQTKGTCATASLSG